MSTPRLEMRNVSKTFGSMKVLDGASLTLAPGEVHALIGQNGSGKSTLIKILSGFHAPDRGAEIYVNGVRTGPPVRPRRLAEAGVTFVHQDLGLVPGLSVLENVRVGRLRRGRFTRLVQWRSERAAVSRTLEYLGSDIDPDTPVARLSLPQRGLIAIARALQGRTGDNCIVLDEATQNLPKEVLPEFYRIIRQLTAAGTSVVLVSHRLDEVLALADRVTVLRDGHVVASGLPAARTDERELMTLMLGYEVEQDRISRAEPLGHAEVALQCEDLTAPGVSGATFSVRRGEVLGLTGVVDAGHDEVPYLLAGARRAHGGVVQVRGQRVSARTLDVARAGQLGIALVPRDRGGEGLAMTLSLVENLTAPRVQARRWRFWLGRSWQRREFSRAVELLGIVPPRPELAAAQLSGGNQQKLLVSKWMLQDPAVLVLHEPTQAVDVGARHDLLWALRRAADTGVAVVIVSIEAEDLASVCDRVLIFDSGAVVRELGDDLTAEGIRESLLHPAGA